jgi:hypothetical protein
MYETGGLFRAHRDTEKTDGMFGTLVVVLPEAHSGGDLIVRHETREVAVSLSSSDISQLRFAAFYADCEHEVNRITEGSRVAVAQSFDPGRVIVSALSLMRARHRKATSFDDDFQHLWRLAAGILLARRPHPPQAPKDWHQAGRIHCTCGDCRALEAFMRDRAERTQRFPLRKDRRRHLHEQIQRHDLDMTHETERRGSPQTLVCTKTRRTYDRQCAEHRIDVTSMTTLLRLRAAAKARVRPSRRGWPPRLVPSWREGSR